MFSLRRLFRKYVYGLVIEEETIKAAAIDWHPVSKCRYCQRPLMAECQFCPHCGYDLTERHTTAQVRLIELKPVQPASIPKTATGMIKAYQLPGERYINTLARVRRMNENKR